MKIVTSAEMREIDRRTSERFGVPSLILMENAGQAVADFTRARYPHARQIAVICGKGNNGGDGFVVARKLTEAGKEVRTLLLADPSDLAGDAAEMFRKLANTPVVVRYREDLRQSAQWLNCDVLIDAILGTGFRPPVSGLYAEAIAIINSGRSPVVSVDIPSGADADIMGEQAGFYCRSDAMVTFTAPRPAQVFGMLTRGPTVIAPIGSPDEAIVSQLQLELTTAREVAPLIGPRPPAANKGNFGHVLVVGGSLGKAGAAAMAGMSALRAGAGLATVATAKSVLPTAAGFHPEVMTEPLEETEAGTISMRALEYGRMDALAQGKSVLALGPGISRHPETSEFVRTVVAKAKTPVVLDADGLNAYEGRATELPGLGRLLVITPHPGEMARLIKSTAAAVQSDRINIARSFAREHGVIVVLKGHRTLVADRDGTIWANATGNPGMATGGTGDILTGMIAGLMAQNPQRAFTAVTAAVHLHGLAGDVARETMGELSLVATDLIRALPEAMRRVTQAATSAVVTVGA
ncbi:MAG TPA: NAD(P)H-hydrate dehydratase [Terriglobales bacterium]|nr:NAD(P)H-hydrate dehydratase [Terriglobales bacterium]